MEAGRTHRALTREAEELAALYGAEAGRLFGEHSWEQLEPSLAEGWRRIRGSHALDWPQVRPRVHAAWLAARLVERCCG